MSVVFLQQLSPNVPIQTHAITRSSHQRALLNFYFIYRSSRTDMQSFWHWACFPVFVCAHACVSDLLMKRELFTLSPYSAKLWTMALNIWPVPLICTFSWVLSLRMQKAFKLGKRWFCKQKTQWCILNKLQEHLITSTFLFLSLLGKNTTLKMVLTIVQLLQGTVDWKKKFLWLLITS